MRRGAPRLSQHLKATVFHFDGYTFDVRKKTISHSYHIEFANHPSLKFTETLVLPRIPNKVTPALLKNILEPLHLILGISYYKLYCPPKIVIPFGLSSEQAEFWNTVYKKGLGEFLYKNNIDPKTIASFPITKKIKTTAVSLPTRDRALLGIGGGKDSIVAAELLTKMDVTSFLLETQKPDRATQSVIHTMGNPSLTIKRIIDPLLFEVHEGSYNGHIPISAIYAFIGLLSAVLHNYRYVIVGNEYTSNIGNLTWKGQDINHQWSKSAEFEAMLQHYTRQYITADIVYFSLLRPFYEIRVVKMFAQYKKYFPLFTSCNKNFTIHKERPSSLWCGQCPKCAYVFLLLAAFLKKKELVTMFGKNMLSDKTLLPLYKDLLGFGTLKPFDCVGTFEESRAALYLASKQFKNETVVKEYVSQIHNPQNLVQMVLKTKPSPTLPTPFRFLGIENVCIVGYGKEGIVTEKYIKKTYPHLKIGILDASRDKDYLSKQTQYDLAIKTPGLPKGNITIPYTTATNIFFSSITNAVIGITGSKGKSTTASLVYEMLKSGGKNVRLIGNIGKPMLEVLLGTIDPKLIFVVELSSYMLDDIEYSPNVAVLLNLFPEHMDYHGGVKNYYAAKERIFVFQKPGDVALREPFTQNIPLNKKDIPLLGSHNIKNIQAAVGVARLFHISDTAIKKAILNFKSLPHRLQRVGTYEGIEFYDDAISTTPESTIAAIEALSSIGTIFLGGQDRGYDFSQLASYIKKRGIKNIVLFPDSGDHILTHTSGLNILKTDSMEKAVEFAFRYTPKGTICLLSTASPSYSIWKNFEEKGELFQRYITLHQKNKKAWKD